MEIMGLAMLIMVLVIFFFGWIAFLIVRKMRQWSMKMWVEDADKALREARYDR